MGRIVLISTLPVMACISILYFLVNRVYKMRKNFMKRLNGMVEDTYQEKEKGLPNYRSMEVNTVSQGHTIETFEDRQESVVESLSMTLEEELNRLDNLTIHDSSDSDEDTALVSDSEDLELTNVENISLSRHGSVTREDNVTALMTQVGAIMRTSSDLSLSIVVNDGTPSQISLHRSNTGSDLNKLQEAPIDIRRVNIDMIFISLVCFILAWILVLRTRTDILFLREVYIENLGWGWANLIQFFSGIKYTESSNTSSAFIPLDVGMLLSFFFSKSFYSILPIIAFILAFKFIGIKGLVVMMSLPLWGTIWKTLFHYFIVYLPLHFILIDFYRHHRRYEILIFLVGMASAIIGVWAGFTDSLNPNPIHTNLVDFFPSMMNRARVYI